MNHLGGWVLSLLLVVLVLIAPENLRAQSTEQPPALLVADQLYITRDRVLVAAGNVEAFHGDVRLTAQQITYDRRSGALAIAGPITLSDGKGTIVLADAAQLDDDMRNGILRGARVVIEKQLQLASLQVARVDGRYHQLYKTAVTSCRVCEDGKPPLWQIRAKRVVHDTLERQLYFESAQLRIGRMPVIWVPRMRLPDPTVKRATGFLIPSIRTTSQLGTGLKVPYFIALGDHRDLTLTPYLSSSTRTMEFRYRQSFVKGDIILTGALTRDDLRPGDWRGYLFASGLFQLDHGYKLSFNIETTSDEAYLKQYGYSSKDRLQSDLTLWRVRRDESIRASFINFETLRDGEVNNTMPTIVVDGEYERRFFPTALRGGELRLSLAAHSHRRLSDFRFDGPDPDSITDGRDVARLQAQLTYLDGATWGGLRAEWQAGLTASLIDVSQDAVFDDKKSEITPYAALTLRYPLARHGATGVTQTLEPIAQVAWTGGKRLFIPNEESTRVEFDQGNLLSMSRFPRPDRRERGAVAALGLNWARFNPGGWDAALTIAQVFREEADTSFSSSSGLSGTSSDLLIAGQLRGWKGISFTARSLFDEDFEVSKAELRGEYAFNRGRVGGSYVWLSQDPAEDRMRDVSEVSLAGAFDLDPNWTATADWRYDTQADRAATAGIGLRYVNECVRLDLTVDRSYASSTSVEPSTNIGFNIGLRGFSAETGTERNVRSCSN